MFRILAAAVITFFVAVPAMAQAPITQVMGDRLRAGELQLLEQDLAARLAASPADDQARFALGTTQFIRTIETMAQAMYRHGLEPPREFQNQLPFFRFPLPSNPSPQPLDYEKLRQVFLDALQGFAKSEATLAKMGEMDVKLPIAIGLARLDLNGDGKAEEQEALWRVLDASLGGGNIPPEAAERYIITFDRADASWLRGYTHLLSALIEFGLAHDQREAFNASYQLLFPRAGLPASVLNSLPRPDYSGFNDGALADFISLVHLTHWTATEPGRLASAHSHLESVVKLSRENWRFILAETDDEAEWIPSPRQKNAVIPGAPVTQQTVDGWTVFLSEFEAILQGKKLIPHWRLAKGINFKRALTESRTFDPILWAQGSAALPYLENGPVTDAQTWNRIMGMFEGNFLGYAVWFN